MSFDALMRWEWEGGTPAPVRERNEAPHTELAEHTVGASAADRGAPERASSRVRLAPTVETLAWR